MGINFGLGESVTFALVEVVKSTKNAPRNLASHIVVLG